ncbi:hypothetical protein [Luteolibacter soli]|uniref:DUF4328 domain-containing protein n=1 Tax=Luteolibacter soli TaxID=3135280 RepID=A0ABU9ATP1_9BACT
MKPETKVVAIIFGYCAILWVTNWSLSHEYAREVGHTASSLDLRGLGALFGFVSSIVLARRIWQVWRVILDARVRVPKSARLWGDWGYLWLLLPLLIHTDFHSNGSAEDGADVHTVFEYGSSAASFLLSGLAIMLFQLLVRLEAFNPENRNAEQAETGHRLPVT